MSIRGSEAFVQPKQEANLKEAPFQSLGQFTVLHDKRAPHGLDPTAVAPLKGRPPPGCYPLSRPRVQNGGAACDMTNGKTHFIQPKQASRKKFSENYKNQFFSVQAESPASKPAGS